MELIIREEGRGQIIEGSQLAQQRLSAPHDDKEIGTWGVGGSTFRAYRNYAGSPSNHYRPWAESHFQTIRNVTPPHSREGFLELHDRAVESLTKHWNREEGVSGKELEFPYSHKLVDLFFKFSARHEDLNQDIRRLIVNFSNTPIDKFSLQLLQACYCGIIISPKPAMGDISRLEDYRFLQNLIQELMADLNLPASYFDYTAWEPFH